MMDQKSLEIIADSFETLARRELTKEKSIGFRICVFTDTHLYGMPQIDAGSPEQKAFIGDMVRWFVRKYKGQAVALVSEAWMLAQKTDDDGDVDGLTPEEYAKQQTGSLGDNPDSVEIMLISVTSALNRVDRIRQFDRAEDGTPHNLREIDNNDSINMGAGNFGDFFRDPELNDREKQIVQAEAKKVLRKGLRLDRTGLRFAAPGSARLPGNLN